MIEKNIRLQPHHARDLLVGRRSDGRRPGYQPPGGGATSEGSGADIRGDGEYMMKIRRVLPDFLQQTGDARVTLNLKNYPTDSQASSSLGPFTTTTSTTKIDTRARARAISLKVSNDSTNQHWKLGTFRIDTQPDGRR